MAASRQSGGATGRSRRSCSASSDPDIQAGGGGHPACGTPWNLGQPAPRRSAHSPPLRSEGCPRARAWKCMFGERGWARNVTCTMSWPVVPCRAFPGLRPPLQGAKAGGSPPGPARSSPSPVGSSRDRPGPYFSQSALEFPERAYAMLVSQFILNNPQDNLVGSISPTPTHE